jgi:xanthine dehydrogenase large subunit
MEALWWNDDGVLRTHSPSTYKIPTAREWPPRFAVEFFDRPNREETIHRSKAVGEPPLMLALSAFHAIRDALAGASPGGAAPPLDAPATPEAILRAIGALGDDPLPLPVAQPATGVATSPAPTRRSRPSRRR